MQYLHDLLTMMQAYPTVFYIYVVILGLLVGSFLNVVIYRLPVMMENNFKDEFQEYFHPEQPLPKRERFNLMVPRSRCPNCGHKITAWENIPVLSYIFLRGKCSGCGQPISLRYPLVEAFTGLMTFIVAWKFGPTAAGAGAIVLTWGLIAIAGIDFDKMLIPDEIIYPLLWLGLLFNWQDVFVSLDLAVLGAAAGYLILWGIYWGFKLLTGKEGMGYGDFKLTACLGAWLGIKMLPAIIFTSALAGAVIGGIYLLCTYKRGSRPIPFGPYIATAGFIVLLYGNEINSWYLNLIMGY